MAVEQLAKYREKHVIEPSFRILRGGSVRIECAHDHIPILAKRNGKPRHDPDEIRRLARLCSGSYEQVEGMDRYRDFGTCPQCFQRVKTDNSGSDAERYSVIFAAHEFSLL